MDMPKIGTEFGGYRIQGLIGRGGMSVVYLAEHPRLSRTVALKIIAPELAEDDVFRERFVRESRVAASLDHPNIIPIFDTGDQDGLLYIVMRYIKNDLRSLIRQEGELSVHRTLAFAAQVGGALDTAHRQGLVHRDVKPANVLVAIRGGADGEDHSYLTDFGLTKHLTSRSGLTGSGQFVGTVDYMSPEQIEGKQADGRADVYALGCVMFQALTGQVPFEKDADAAVIWAHLKEPPPRPSLLRRNLPPSFDDVIAKAMAKDPEERFASCADFIRAARQELESRSGMQDAPVGTGGETVLRGGATPAPPPVADPSATDPGAGARAPAASAAPWPPPSPAPGEPAPPPSVEASRAGAPSYVPERSEPTRASSAPEQAAQPMPAPDDRMGAPESGRRSRTPLLAGLVVLLVLLGAGAWAMFGRNTDPDEGTAPSAASGAGHGGHSAPGGFPDQIEQELALFHVPDNIQPYCHRLSEEALAFFNRDAFRALTCAPGGAIEEVRYYLMHDASRMRSLFAEQFDSEAPGPGDADCGIDQTERVHWSTTADDGRHKITPRAKTYSGSVLCYQKSDGIWTIEWTDGATKIYSVATSAEPNPEPLVDAWRRDLGPAHPEHVDDIYECSGASHDLPASGELVGTVLQVNEADGCMLFSDGEHLSEIDITESTQSQFDSLEALIAHLTDHQQQGTAIRVGVETGPQEQVLATSVEDA